MSSMSCVFLSGFLLVLNIFLQIASSSEELSPARITEPPIDTRAQAGFFIFLICKAQGNPKPSVQFLINGKIQKSEGHRKIIRTFDYGASLRQQIQMDNNNDRIECVSENHLGVDRKSAMITVIDSNGEAPVGFPTILNGPMDILGQIGKSAKIRCEVSADPPAKVTWIKNSFYQLDRDDERFQIVGTGSLMIKNIKEKDSGSYECMARNKIGTVISQTGLLQIRNSPMTPQIIDFKNHIEVSVGHGANLTCNAEGYPIPNVWWAVSIGNINNQRAEQRPLSEAKPSTSTIHITDITESAIYTCFATNNMGTVRKTTNIVVKKKPLTPKSVSTREIGTTYTLIDWIPVDSNPAVDSYTLLIKDLSNENSHLGLRQIANIFPTKSQETGKVSYNITDLKPFTKYEAKVIAVNNNIGTSEASNPTIFRTNELPPSTAPRDVYATAISYDSIAVSWKPPSQTNGRITGYKMYYSEKFNAPIGMWTVVRTTETKYYLNSLVSNSTYYIKVNAFNNAGDGPVSDSFPIIVIPGVPPVPQNLRGAGLSSTSIQIMWSAPMMPDGMTLQNYVLKFKLDNDDKATVTTEVLDPDKTQYLIQGLKPGTLYYISLAGKTTHGVGVSAQLVEKTKDEIPGMPQGDSLHVIGSTSIKITWKGPVKMLDQVKYYIVKWSSRSDDPNMSQNTEEKTSKINADKKNPDKLYELMLNNLTPNLWYKIEIRAGSLKGEGSPYVFAVEKTSGEVPSQPKSFRLSQLLRLPITNGLVVLAGHLSWDPPENQHGKILLYRIGITLIGPPEYLMEIGPKRILRNVSVSNTYVTNKDDALGYGRTYKFEVRALNEINFGPPAIINQTMPESKPAAPPSKLEIQAFRNTVKLKWLLPPHNYRNGIITGYKICYYNVKDQTRSTKEIFVKSETSYKIADLTEKTNYVFMIRAVNKEGDGPWSPSSSIYISSEFFPAPESVKAEAISDSKIKVSWSYPVKSNFITDLQSQIIGFAVVISKNRKNGNIYRKESTGPVTAIVINKINPDEYFVKVKAIIRDERQTEWSNYESVLVTKSKYSDRNIRNLLCSGQNKAIKVMWTRPEEYADISSFQVKVAGLRRFRSIDDSTQLEKILPRTASVQFKPNEQYSYSYLLDNLEPNTIYDVTIIILYIPNSKNEPISKMTSCVTLMTKPQKVLFPKPIPQRKITDQVVLRLYRTDETYGRISHYYLVIGPVIESHITPSDVNINKTIANANNAKKIKTSSYRYVAAQFTSALFHSKPYIDFTLGLKDPTGTFQIKDWIYLLNSPLQKKIKYRAFFRACIIADGIENATPEQTCTSSDWSSVFSTEINREAEVFTIAVIAGIAGIILLVFVCIGFACFLKRSHNKVNRPLNSNDPCLKQPLMMQPAGTLPHYNNICVTGNSSRHGYSDSLRTNSDLCAGTSVLTPNSNHQQLSVSNPMFEQRSLEMKKIINTPAPDLVQNAISISNSNRPAIAANRLESHINDLRANDNFLFSQEYESIDPGQQFTWENSNLEVNRCKNRYANVIAYDHSRILLQPVDRIPGSDYINANYIDGYKKPNAYIASQGPLSNTFGDFWRMVWEQGTRTIVMMTKLEERTRIKCDQYWPNKSTESYADGRICVTLMDTKELAYYAIRTFMISSNTPDLCSEKEKREIKQYQFTAWPDHGVPENPMPLLMFLRRVQAASLTNSGPIIVHCSAGVGRTGAYIAIDATLERIRFEMTFDIFGQVSLMRAQRNYMVQTEDQYVFVHDVILDAVKAGNTEVSVQSISNHIQKLLRADCTSKNQRAPGIELEFQKLSQFKNMNGRCTSANLPVNRLKNRLVNILPYEYNRICLQPIRGCEGSDYINASFIDGYNNSKAYIATQAPLVETVEDFWRMIWEHNSTIVVMLTKLREMGREKCHRYWPTERSSRFQYFVVDPMVEYNMPNFVLQEFKVTDARDGQSRTVRQFQFTEWPEQGVPHQAREAFIDFIGQVHKTKEQFGQEGPITVHCSAGVGRTGVFLTLSIALDRLRQEGVLDLFQTVRMLRYQRANMVQSEEQYRFCYLAAQDYVNSFDNFVD